MNKVIEFTGCKLAIRLDAINAIDINPNDKKEVRMFISGMYAPGGYCLHHASEEDALRIYNQIVDGMRNNDD